MVLDLCIFCIAAVYFVVAGQVVTDYRGQLITSINNVRLIYANLNLIKAVKLYTLESVVDGSSFSSYTLLNKSL